MGTKTASNFWSSADSTKQDMVREFYEHIEYEHPKALSGRSKREYGWCGCSWCATSVKYPTYNGPRVTNL